MYIERKTTTSVDEYHAMIAYLDKHNFRYHVTFDEEQEQFEFTYSLHEDYYTSVMHDLDDMRRNADNFEYFDSLNCAISAIKTLIDMGVLNNEETDS